MQLFGSSGIRRVVDRDMVELSLRVGLAVGKVYGSVVVGRDTRTSGDVMKHAVVAGLLAAGARCFDAGIIPTPTLALAAREFAAGAMITASHNPPEYNGIKLFNTDGSSFDTKQSEQIENMVLGGSLTAACWTEMNNTGGYFGAVEKHIEHILKDFPAKLKLKVVVDAGCGAASVITPHLLRRMGCEVVALNCYPSGFFPHDVEPVAANLGDLIRVTKELGANLGIAHDGDADRMMAVDDKGRFITGDKMLALLARYARAKEVVTTVDASMVIDEMGMAVRRTKVGDVFVSEELRKGGQFGGEPSGAWIFPASSFCPDGIYAAALITAIASERKLSTLVDEIPQYPLVRGNVASQGVKAADLQARLMALRPLSVNNIDGTKLKFADGWILVRPSGTEPKIRVTAEAKTEARARELYEGGVAAIKECMGKGKEGKA